MAKRKNILLILADQQRLDTVSAYGQNTVCRTPHIDALAAAGMKFTNAFTPAPICGPARASLMTGLFPHNHGVIDNFTDIRPGIPLLGPQMRKAGYFCGLVGKWHVSPTLTPADCGFAGKPFMGYGYPGSGVYPSLKFNQPPENEPNYYAEYLKERGLPIPDVSHGFFGDNPALQIQEMYCKLEGPVESGIEAFVAHETCRLLDEAAGGEAPFFLWVNFWGPHSPSIVPEPYFSQYDPRDIPEHPSYCETFENKPYSQYLVEKMWGLGDYGWPGMADIAAKYYGNCSLIDDMVGQMVDRLRENGQLDDTVILYAADHGDCLGAHKLIEKGPFLYDEITRIPLVVYGLGQEDNDSLVYLHELMPTLLDLAGTVPAAPTDGNSLLPLMTGQAADNGRSEIFGEFDRHFYVGRQRFLRTRDYQLTFNENERGELYDLQNDPYQLENRCYDPSFAAVKSELLDRMSAQMQRLRDPAAGWFERIRKFY